MLFTNLQSALIKKNSTKFSKFTNPTYTFNYINKFIILLFITHVHVTMLINLPEFTSNFGNLKYNQLRERYRLRCYL